MQKGYVSPLKNTYNALSRALIRYGKFKLDGITTIYYSTQSQPTNERTKTGTVGSQ